MEIWLQVVKFLHILAVVFMAWPLYALITVNERGRLGVPLGSDADRYMENIIKGQTIRCYVFQLTALVTGVVLVSLYGVGLNALLTNWVLAAKTGLLLALMGLLSYVHLGVQPRLDRLFQAAGEAEGNPTVPEEIASRIGPLRVRRKRLAGLCLFLVITTIILGLQVFARYNPILTGALIALAALFAWQAYKRPIGYGWV